MAESMADGFRKQRNERAAKVAETLKYIMAESIEAQTCCEGWDEAIRLIDSVLLKFDLVPEGILIEHLSMKDRVKLLSDEIEYLRGLEGN